MRQPPSSPFSQWRILIATSEEKVKLTLERLFEGRVADIETSDTGGSARSRIGDSFGRPIRLALIDANLISEKELSGWTTSLKNNLARPQIILLSSEDSKHVRKLEEGLAALGTLDPNSPAADFVRGLLKLTISK